MPNYEIGTIKRASTACVPCRRRKVKCNRQTPCQQCQHHGLRCSQSAPSDKTRSGMRRGHVLSDYRHIVSSTTTRALAPSSTLQIACGGGEAVQTAAPDSSDNRPFLYDLVPRYAGSVYATHPIVPATELFECIELLQSDDVAAAFAYSAIAVTIHCTAADTLSLSGEARSALLRYYVDRACDTVGAQRPFSSVSVKRAMTHLFLANCLVAIGDRNAAFIHLRQAVSITEVLLSQSAPGSSCTSPRLWRLYWLVYIHERYQCISESRQPILKPLVETTCDDEDVDVNIRVGFRRLVKLFLLLDGTFLAFWTGTDTRTSITADWIAQKRDDFLEDEQQAQTEHDQLSIAQRADLTITRHWLSALLWRIAMTQNLLRDLPSDVCFSLLFPLHVSQRLRQVLEQIPSDAVLTHGVGIVQKLFELTDTIADVFLHVSSTTDQSSTKEQDLDNFLYLKNVLLAFSCLDSTRRSIIEEKMARITPGAVAGWVPETNRPHTKSH